MAEAVSCAINNPGPEDPGQISLGLSFPIEMIDKIKFNPISDCSYLT